MAPKKLSFLKGAIVLVCACCLSLTGCYDAKEIDQEVFTLVIGVDKGTGNMIRVTFQVSTYKEDGGNGGGSQNGGSAADTGELDGTVISTVEAPSLIESINMLNSASNRQISLSQTKMIIFSEEYAREGVGRYIEPLTRFREVGELMRVLVCRGRAEDYILENRSFIGGSLPKDIELSFLQSANTGYYPDVFLNEFYVRLLSPYAQAIAIYTAINDFDSLPEDGMEKGIIEPHPDLKPGEIPRKGGNKREMLGTVVFSGDKMVGYLNQNETRFYLLATGKYKRGLFTLDDPKSAGDFIVLEVTAHGAPKVTTFLENEIPYIYLEMLLDIDIAAIQNRENYFLNPSAYLELEKYIETYFVRGMEEVIRKTQQEWNSDIFEFGKKIAGNFWTIPQFEEYNWLERYREAKIDVKVKANISRAGYYFHPRPIEPEK
ncbi:MAG: Ger(x)C family spore germination protein [Peptococcaceae bacterium]|nr:Ger(x)C family spore germination protein [Peptococcaceae bacterium]